MKVFISNAQTVRVAAKHIPTTLYGCNHQNNIEALTGCVFLAFCFSYFLFFRFWLLAVLSTRCIRSTIWNSKFTLMKCNKYIVLHFHGRRNFFSILYTKKHPNNGWQDNESNCLELFVDAVFHLLCVFFLFFSQKMSSIHKIWCFWCNVQCADVVRCWNTHPHAFVPNFLLYTYRFRNTTSNGSGRRQCCIQA